MGKTFRRNSGRKPKQQGRIFDKKDKKNKWDKKPSLQTESDSNPNLDQY